MPAVDPVPLSAVRLGGRPDLPLLVLGPAEGCTATELWGAVARHLAADFQVVAWDLPGHGTNRAGAVAGPPVVAGLAAGVLDLVDAMARGIHLPVFVHVGVGIGGEVGRRLAEETPHRVAAVLTVGLDDLAPAEVLARRVRDHVLAPGDPAGGDAGPRSDALEALVGAVRAARASGLAAAEVEEAVGRTLLEDSSS